MIRILNRAFLTLLLLECSCVPDLSVSSYGRVRIAVGEKEVFLKRAASGLSIDVTVLSPSDDLCKTPNSQTDYVFDGAPPAPLYYKVENGTLILFVSYAAKRPDSGEFPVQVVQKELNPLEFTELKKRPDVKLLELPFDNRLRCSH